MDKEKYMDDLRDIREIMSKSSRFMSLSGISGVIIGLLAIAAAFLAYYTIYAGQDYLDYRFAELSRTNMFRLLFIGGTTLFLALATGIFFTVIKAKKEGQKLFDRQTYRLLINLFIPLVTGGILSLILLFRGLVGLVAPITLIFYGLALVNGSKYSIDELRSLGISEIILGLVASYFIGYGLLFWGIGFGVLHILYGLIMHIRYGS